MKIFLLSCYWDLLRVCWLVVGRGNTLIGCSTYLWPGSGSTLPKTRKYPDPRPRTDNGRLESITSVWLTDKCKMNCKDRKLPPASLMVGVTKLSLLPGQPVCPAWAQYPAGHTAANISPRARTPTKPRVRPVNWSSNFTRREWISLMFVVRGLSPVMGSSSVNKACHSDYYMCLSEPFVLETWRIWLKNKE